MGIAKETLAEFFRRHPEAQSGKLSMEELNLLMAGFMQEVNAAPKDDFDGLAAEQMHFLLHEPFGRQSVLAWGQKELDDQLVGSSPLLMLLDLLMAELDRQGELKLTTKGNLPVAVCTMLVERDLLPLPYGEHLKKPGEDKVPYLWPVKDFLLVERLAKKRNNKLSLTAAGRKFMELPTGDRFQALFEFFTDRFPWENLFDLTDAGYAGHLGWAYSL